MLQVTDYYEKKLYEDGKDEISGVLRDLLDRRNYEDI
jgi:hypothetical protein